MQVFFVFGTFFFVLLVEVFKSWWLTVFRQFLCPGLIHHVEDLIERLVLLGLSFRCGEIDLLTDFFGRNVGLNWVDAFFLHLDSKLA